MTERPRSRRRFLAGLASATALAGVSASAGCLGRPDASTESEDAGNDDGSVGDATLGFAGDVMLGRNVDDERADDPPEAVWGDLHSRLTALDGFCANLECTLSTRGSPRPGWTYHFRADPAWAVPALQAANTAWVSLANNHQLDFGPPALRDTLDALTEADIAHSGAGTDFRAATAPAVTEIGDLRVAFVSLTDQAALYAAGPTSSGTAYLRLDARLPGTRRVVDAMLERAREANPDLVVASLHWGPNWVVRPADQYRRFGRWLIDRNVDVVHGHSAHVIQGVETYRGRPIIHDAGDFLDDYAVKDDLHNDRSFLFELQIRDGEPTRLDLVPVEIEGLAVHRPDESVARWLRERMRTLSAPLGTEFERADAGLRLDL